MTGLIIAAPRSGSGKTIVTLGLLHHLRQRGLRVAAAKVGPDYIDPSFLAAAAGSLCRNLDPWAMRSETLAAEIAALESEAELVVCEGVMGLFDGAGLAAEGSTASLAAITGWPVILVVSLEGQAASAAALVAGFARHQSDITLAGVIFNRIASARQRDMAAAALQRALPQMPLLGALPREEKLTLPSRHLGLIPAGEHRALESMIDHAAAHIAAAIDIEALLHLARPARAISQRCDRPLPPLGNSIAIARDDAFAFAYDSVLKAWRDAGVSLSFFSPLAGEAPSRDADAIYLPGGYPELFAGAISANRAFIEGLRHAAARGAILYGECGGYMVLGEGLIDGDGAPHAMAGLLPVSTSFAKPKLQLGYRAVSLATSGPLGAAGQRFRGHEFHYATIVAAGAGAPLFLMMDADGATLGPAGSIAGRVMGSFVHLVDRAGSGHVTI